MEKKYQIFISSTYLDLKDERQAVSKAILDLGHIPSGMEMFPATNSSQIDYIKKIIDDCDYYIIIVGGRYGSLGEDGISYTEQEYNYAMQMKIPILAFIHSDIDELKSRNVDANEGLKARLNKFREKLQHGRLTKYWTDVASLQAGAITSLTSEFRENPKIGWRRDDGQLPLAARKQVETLNEKLNNSQERWYKEYTKVASYENLAEASIGIRYSGHSVSAKLFVSGEEIIRAFASRLRRGLAREDIYSGLEEIVSHSLKETDEMRSTYKISEQAVDDVQLFFEVFEIAEIDDQEALFIKEEKKYLLKAAFRPLKQVIDDEIPF